ncbi:MAG: glycerol-3-phosphate cytidylyltransferase [Candidatus Poribacteria bacterium]|nr:MAG: glycerol-3-phosphate cytidylyltransferase [Candidatus Poribacteria bacterium]
MILSREQLAQVVQEAKRAGKVVVTTNGCFDILHVGHLRYLEEAKKLGDLLIVGVNSDASVRRLKGPTRPVIPDVERAELIAALKCVDYVTIFDEDTPCELLEVLKPDVHVKGGDYTLEQVIEREVVERHGGRVVVGIKVPARSTTEILRAIQERLSQEATGEDASGHGAS